ncbi:MAG: UDP-N-acetylmuramate--L-alanine ligase [Spirochaetaceae bacterium]|jgi:UDP-N-acetylmuramate--alanine ligase|nr:UDP-N-acetylmuramate--L-alanine ligase [Spirochaetaceae bacterium]
MVEEFLFRKGSKVYCIGIKGTGMCALAELLCKAGVQVSGSDTAEVFYTDTILAEMHIPYFESFAAEHIPAEADAVLYSAAYSAETNPELAEAERRGLPVLKYADALGAYSKEFDSSGIAGVHGKTTTTAIAGTLIRAAKLPGQILAGSGVSVFRGHSTLSLGSKYFIAETCEYRRHFLAFHPRRIVLTGIESDHQDYYPTYDSIRDAFVEYLRKLPSGGELIYCADNPGACEAAEILRSENRDIAFTQYGFKAEGAFRLNSYRVCGERIVLELAGFPGELKLRIPGRHSALNAAGALALTDSLMQAEHQEWNDERRERVRWAMEDFKGSKRRSEILGEGNGVLFMDDYAHHPTAIQVTLEGIKDFYPDRRIIVSFMSHTYSRTAALLDKFAGSFEKADILILHKIYASARETYSGGVTGRTLFEKTKGLHHEVYYTEEPADAAVLLKKILRPGDLFVTMGAGDNWKLGRVLMERLGGTAL